MRESFRLVRPSSVGCARFIHTHALRCNDMVGLGIWKRTGKLSHSISFLYRVTTSIYTNIMRGGSNIIVCPARLGSR